MAPCTEALPSSRSSERVRRVGPVAALIAVVALESVHLIMLLSDQFFFADDFINFDNARAGGLTWSMLSTDIFSHFIPLFNFTNYLLVRFVPYQFGAVVILDVVIYVVALLSFYRLALFAAEGRPWVPVVLTGLLGASLVIVPGMLWWSNAGSNLPSTACTLLCIDGGWRYLRTPRRHYLVQASVALIVGLGFFESTLVAVFALVVLFVIVERRLSTGRTLVRDALRRWPLWLAIGLPSLADLSYRVVNRSAYALPAAPTLSQMGTFLRTAWEYGFAPGMIGTDYPYRALLGSGSLTVVIAQLLVFGAAVVTIARAPEAWRSWLFFFLTFGADLVATGYARVNVKGAGTGLTYDYLFLGPFLFYLAFAHALGRRPSGDHLASAEAESWGLLPASVGLLLLGFGVVVNGVASAATIASTTNGGQSVTLFENPASPHSSKEYFDRLGAALDAYRRARDRPVIFNTLVSEAVTGNWYLQFRPDSEFVSDVFPWLTFGRYAPNGLVIDPGGNLVKAEFQQVDFGSLDHAEALNGVREYVEASGGRCFTAGAAMDGTVLVPFSDPVRLSQLPNPQLRLSYSSSRTISVVPLLLSGSTEIPALRYQKTLQLKAGDHSELVDVNIWSFSDLVLPVPSNTTVCLSAANGGGAVPGDE